MRCKVRKYKIENRKKVKRWRSEVRRKAKGQRLRKARWMLENIG